MKLALFVHDLKLEIGHSNALVESVRHLPRDFLARVTEIRAVAYTATPLAELFPEFPGTLRLVRVPFPGLRPVLVKSLFFQLWTKIYNALFLDADTIKIGIGISCLDVDAANMQYVHHLWTERGLALESGHVLRRLYKRLLFRYFELCEDYLLRRRVKFFSPANYLTEYLRGRAPGIDAATIYSGVNLDRFALVATPKASVLADLVIRYPVLAGLDVTRPVFLFVGAYERKGLPEALELLRRNVPGAQFVVIGSPSFGRRVRWPAELEVRAIPFTREVPRFYALADAFVFPSMYETFGLVLFEAMAMGLTVITNRSQIGASELLEGLPEVHFCDRPGFTFPAVAVKSPEERRALREERLRRLGDVSWQKAGRELAAFLTKN
jgi:glycosyltransferase involved in cell wall biosynthesis